MQINNYQIVFIFDEAQKVFMRIYSIAFQIDFEYMLDALQGSELPYEIILCQQSFNSMHILNVFQRFQLVI